MAASGPTPEHSARKVPQGQLGLGFGDSREPDQRAVERRIYRVADLVEAVRSHIEREYASVLVEGEVSNFRKAPSGHIYFTLKDGEAQLPVVLFRRQALLLRFRPDDGQHLLVRGKVSVYEQRGQMQLVAETLEPMGAGALQVAFEQLRERLRKEGLFAEERKRPLPAFPRCVGLITSPSGAAVHDFLNIAARRHANLDILVFPAIVQGDSAAAEVAAGIRYFNRERNVDVIVIARGGGSMEDLACFNSEPLARIIVSSTLPVVSAIGHETDFTITDFVADLRAPTPSAAAELITSAQHRIEERVDELRHRLARAARYQLMMANDRLSRVSIAAAAARLRDTLGRKQQRVDELYFRLLSASQRQRAFSAGTLQELTGRLLREDPSHKLKAQQEKVRAFETRLERAAAARLDACRGHHALSSGRLQGLSPLSVLGRGYALVFREGGELVQSAQALQAGESVITRLAGGSFKSTVTDTNL